MVQDPPPAPYVVQEPPQVLRDPLQPAQIVAGDTRTGRALFVRVRLLVTIRTRVQMKPKIANNKKTDQEADAEVGVYQWQTALPVVQATEQHPVQLRLRPQVLVQRQEEDVLYPKAELKRRVWRGRLVAVEHPKREEHLFVQPEGEVREGQGRVVQCRQQPVQRPNVVVLAVRLVRERLNVVKVKTI